MDINYVILKLLIKYIYHSSFKKDMRITISGTPGSGKSTIAKLLAKKLGYKHYSVGDFRRNLAKKQNMSINDLNKLGETTDFTDKEADNWQKQLSKEDNFVIDGRLSYYFIPDSVKIYLDADEKVRAERIYNEKRNLEFFKNVGEALNGLRERQESDKKRYKKYYNIDPFQKKHYDIVIDTTNKEINQVLEEIYNKIKSHPKSTASS